MNHRVTKGSEMTFEGLVRDCATCVLERFHDYQDRFRRITLRAPERFANRQWAEVQADTTQRLKLYAAVVDQTETALCILLADQVAHPAIWSAARADYAARIAVRDDRELAETFFNSVSRRIFGTVGVNPLIEFVHDHPEPLPACPAAQVFKTYPLTGPMEPILRQIISAGSNFQINKRALENVLPQMVERVETKLGHRDGATRPAHIEMILSTFYRGQGAYLIGRIVEGERIIPLVMALLHAVKGLVVDALLLDPDGVSIVFSYTRSAFHVSTDTPRALVDFLKTIMPSKPEAEIYSAIGYFKHGKTVLYQDVCRHTAQCTEDRFRLSPGKRGMVMVVFDMAGHEMVVKLIRDRFDTPKKTTRSQGHEPV
jgi:isocitrate dehydrogenase kinase/phosphatase